MISHTAEAQERRWHRTVVIRGDSYPTRSYAPTVYGSAPEHYGLPLEQVDLLSAVHEAAHAVAVLAGRGRLNWVQLPAPAAGTGADSPGGVTDWRSPMPTIEAFAAVLGAGERATDRWLREAGLWSPERAVAVEIGAWGDRELLLDAGNRGTVGFGEGTATDYFVVHDLADALLDEHWPAVTALAEHLVERRYLTGDQVADFTGLPGC
ncbi:hypothetical protein Kpho02_60490 [Kitasatospora phosalacinea]|uniref:Uncharacterized protein n=1 Tax=Kitasatospora phosalacinea TaxID=2065 RepID=A0A9W6QE04_9ACTN|nr:hypothetical protein [Kitasatospora phosalacinea]GLW73751.1 hypothetical protein Kpho02_60490 [Kitasatospora phosalacinea]